MLRFRSNTPRLSKKRCSRAALGCLLALSAVGCAAALPEPSNEDAVRAQERWSDANLSQLERGRALLVSRCSGCHVAPRPQDELPEHWPAVVDEMAEPAGLTPSDRESLVRYLVITATHR